MRYLWLLCDILATSVVHTWYARSSRSPVESVNRSKIATTGSYDNQNSDKSFWQSVALQKFPNDPTTPWHRQTKRDGNRFPVPVAEVRDGWRNLQSATVCSGFASALSLFVRAFNGHSLESLLVFIAAIFLSLTQAIRIRVSESFCFKKDLDRIKADILVILWVILAEWQLFFTLHPATLKQVLENSICHSIQYSFMVLHGSRTHDKVYPSRTRQMGCSNPQMSICACLYTIHSNRYIITPSPYRYHTTCCSALGKRPCKVSASMPL